MFPLGGDNAHLNDGLGLIGAQDIQLGCLAGDQREAEDLTRQFLDQAPKERLGGRVGKLDVAFLIDNQNPVGVLFDDILETLLRRFYIPQALG
jgi:hypothetical protein